MNDTRVRSTALMVYYGFTMEQGSAKPPTALPSVTSDTRHDVLNELSVIVIQVGELLARTATTDPNVVALKEIQTAAHNAARLLRRGA